MPDLQSCIYWIKAINKDELCLGIRPSMPGAEQVISSEISQHAKQTQPAIDTTWHHQVLVVRPAGMVCLLGSSYERTSRE